MKKMDGFSMDIVSENVKRIQAVFPDVVIENKIDIDKLLNILGEDMNDDFERYQFTWKGKVESLQLAGRRSAGTLRPCVEESKNWDDTENLYIEGDNLEVLKLLQQGYHNKVKMIYIDPPYNTGKDFVYTDTFGDSIANYKEITEQGSRSNPETAGRYHTNWLNMMYPRLRLAKTLLTDDGVIFISIDDNEVHNLRKVCDEVFGEDNFVAKMVWQSTPGSNTGTNIITVTEYILVYSKSREDCVFNTIPVTDEEKYIYEDEYVIKRGRYVLNKLDRRMTGTHYSEALNYPIEMPDGKLIYPGSTEEKNNENLNYRWSRTKVEWGIEKGFIVLKNVDGKWNAYFKQYFKVDNNDSPINRSLPHQNLIKLEQFNSTQGTKEIMNFFGNKFFDYPKPTEMIKYLINIYPDKNSIILDFFSGSATTAHAVMQLNTEDGGNRKFIMVQLPEVIDEKSEAYKAGYKNICEIGKERIRRTGDKVFAEWEESQRQMSIEDTEDSEELKSLDVGFKVFKLDSSNMKKWDGTPLEDSGLDDLWNRLNDMTNTIKPNRTDMDVVYKILLKFGIDLNTVIIPLEFEDQGKTKKAYSVREDCLMMICLARDVSVEMVEQMAEYTPGNIVFAEDCFGTDTEITNAELVLKDRDINIRVI